MKTTSTKEKSPPAHMSSPVVFALPAIGLFLLWGCTQAPTSPAQTAQPSPTPRYEESSRPPVQRQPLPTAAGATQSPASEAEKASLVALAQAIKKVNKDWDALQNDYDSWRRNENTCNREVMRQDLEQFLADYSPIMRDAEALNRTPQTKNIAEAIVAAGEREQKALRALIDTWKPGDKGVFEAFEVERTQVNLARRPALDELQDLVMKSSRPSLSPGPQGAPSAEPLDPKALNTFSQSIADLNTKWDNFHAGYDQWRQKGGRCDRQEINLKLIGIASRLSDIRKSIASTEQTASVRPLKELLLEAVQREENALRTLRQTWEPYDPSQFNQFEATRGEINKLRRQALAGIEDLLAK